MAEGLGKTSKKEIVKQILKELHAGLSPAEASQKLLREAGFLTSVEIATIEQELINEGIPVADIQKFCNVHALIFEKALQQKNTALSPSHPLELLKSENFHLKELITQLKAFLAASNRLSLAELKDTIQIFLLINFDFLDQHYQKKELGLFPFLERKGFSGPSQVMWGKHDEVRKHWQKALHKLMDVNDEILFKDFVNNYLNPLFSEVEGMIEKEELILFPTSVEKLAQTDWDQIREVFAKWSAKTDEKRQGQAIPEGSQPEVSLTTDKIIFPSGELSLDELTAILNSLPVDISFVDAEGKVKYFSEPPDRIFARPRSILGRRVENCHPPKSVHVVLKIVEDLKAGKKDYYDFWLQIKDKFVYIRYLAVRNLQGKFLGILEVSQDISSLRNLSGEKRLLSD